MFLLDLLPCLWRELQFPTGACFEAPLEGSRFRSRQKVAAHAPLRRRYASITQVVRAGEGCAGEVWVDWAGQRWAALGDPWVVALEGAERLDWASEPSGRRARAS